MSSTATLAAPELTEALLARMDRPGPRYTSYPTADRFVEAFGPNQYGQALSQRAEGSAVGVRKDLSLYVHIPFCESVCYYCACNKIVTKHHERAAEYLDALQCEVALNRAALGGQQAVSQLHLGGGTPTYLSDAELGRVFDMLRASFAVRGDAEISVEVDPRTATAQRLKHLADLGVNRLSFGVQDFDPAVQVAVHRVQPFDQVQQLMQAARSIGFKSVNVDLIYGLPQQTPQSFERTIAQLAALKPDRVALYAYAHLPARFKPQRRIDVALLPSPKQRIRMLGSAISGMLELGYQYIGMDHFALPGDELAKAKRQGLLHRNFQGYSTQPDCDLIGLGVSSIGRIGATYSQNAKTLTEYYDALEHGRFPTVRGLALARDDLLRRAVIMALMCQGRVSFESISLAYLVDFRRYFAKELGELAELGEMGLVETDEESVRVTPLGWYFVRAVAAVFDRYLSADIVREKFSRII